MNSILKRRLVAVEEENHSPPKKQKTALYLDDYTPIRTIEVTNIEDNVTEEYLRGYFEHAAGPVTDVSIIREVEDNQTTRLAYVTFLVPEDAGRLICDNKLQFNIKFTIKEAETARQPKLNPNVLNFEQINDDCLLHIASYLDLIDIVNFGKASRRLRSVSVQIYRKRTHFSFGPNTGDSSINEMNLAAILQEMGTFIQTIEWHHLQPIHLPYLSQYCHSVTELTLIIPSKDILSSSIKSVKRFFRNLKTLAIYGALFFDITMKAITSSSRLTSLKLSHCPNVQGKFLSTWKNSKLETLKICNSWKVDCEAVFNFEVEHKLAKFSFDAGCSFQQCLRLPPECLSNFTEIEIDFSYFTDNILELLNFEGLIELTSLTMTYKYVNSFEIFNNLLTAMSRIRKLKSLTIDQFRIDADTVNCLASFTNLRKIRLKEVNNTIGRRFYSSLPMHLPNIIELSMQMENSTEEIYSKSICDMITSLVHLKYFSHSSMTWQLLNTILQVRKSRKQTSIEIGVSKLLFNDPIKKEFAAISNGAVILSLIE